MRVSYVCLNKSENPYTNTYNNYSNGCKSINFTSKFSSQMSTRERVNRIFDVVLGCVVGIFGPIGIIKDEVSKSTDFNSGIKTIFSNENLGHTALACAALILGGYLVYSAFFRDRKGS